MIVAYFDSSALAKIGLDEAGSELVRSLWDAASVRATSRLGEVEVAAALASALRARRLSPAAFRRVTADWGDLMGHLVVVELGAEVATHASHLAAAHRLTGADAVHLSSALRLGHDTVFACWDARLRAAAAAEGLVLSPAEIGQT